MTPPRIWRAVPDRHVPIGAIGELLGVTFARSQPVNNESHAVSGNPQEKLSVGGVDFDDLKEASLDAHPFSALDLTDGSHPQRRR